MKEDGFTSGATGSGAPILLAHSFYLARDAKQRERCKPYAPHATLLAAAILRDAGHSVALFDATFAESVGSFERMIERTRPRVVLLLEDTFNFLTKMCTEARRRDALAMVAAARAQGCRVAVNGPDAADHPQLYLAAGAAAVLAGESEVGVADAAAALVAGDRLDDVPGLILPSATGNTNTTPRRWRHDLDALPFPAWDLVDAHAYRAAWRAAHGRFSWIMAASRGCPYSCNWCAKPTFGRRYMQRSPASLAEELARLKRDVAPDHVWFADDIFGMTTEWVGRFAEEVVARGARLPFTIQSRANLIDDAVSERLAAAGAEEVWLGIESGSQRILDGMDKGITITEARNATRALRRHGIRACWFLQLGYPGEDWDDIVMTRDLVRQEQPDEIGVSVSYPLPGTKFHDRVVAELGARRNWRDTGDLAMLFQGTFDTAFYRAIRDALHAEVDGGAFGDLRWATLARRAAAHRSLQPLLLDAVR